MMREVSLYTDGACSGNPGPGGWAAILVHNSRELELSGGLAATTNNQMELLSVINGLRALKERCKVAIYSDSKYVVQAFLDDWISGWLRRDWQTSNRKPVANRELWEQLIALVAEHEVSWHWVKGHDGHAYNERCDLLAVAARDANRLAG